MQDISNDISGHSDPVQVSMKPLRSASGHEINGILSGKNAVKSIVAWGDSTDVKLQG